MDSIKQRPNKKDQSCALRWLYPPTHTGNGNSHYQEGSIPHLLALQLHTGFLACDLVLE